MSNDMPTKSNADIQRLDDLIKNDTIFEKIEAFINRIHEKDIELNAKAQTIFISETKGKDTWGKPIKESHSLAELIGEEMAFYQRIKRSELLVDEMLKQSEETAKSNTIQALEGLTRSLDTRSAVRAEKEKVSTELLRYIEMAYSNNVIDEIGLGKKLKTLEKEVTELREKNANLQKLNDDLAKKIDNMRKYFPDSQGKGEIGDVSF